VARVTLITGASSGIGAATARRISAPGESLVISARGGKSGEKVAALEAVANDCRAAGAEVLVLRADLSEPGAGRELVRQAIAHFGALDRLVSNAGFALAGTTADTTPADYAHGHQVIFNAFVDLTTEALPSLSTSPSGRIVAVSSFVTDQAPGGRLFPSTAAAKGAMEALSRTMAVDLAPKGITVNCVAPGFTEKESAGHSALSNSAWEAAAAMTPNRRLAKPQEIAAAIAFFLGDEAAHITGQTLRIDGGLSLI